MRSRVLSGARLVLLAGPAVLAFFSGGYFDSPRVWAGLIAWALVALAALLWMNVVPRRPGARIALVGLGLLAAWTLISFTWAPIAGSAYHAGQRVVLYAGVLLAASILFRERGALALVEPALVAGALVVVGYGLSERLLPGLLHFHQSFTAQGRLEQPLTYWNGMGEVAALGFVLSARIVGDSARPRALRMAAAAACAPLGMGLYISFSRGALFACAAGLIALLVLVPRREQLLALALSVGAGALAAVASSPFRGVTALTGAETTRETQGLVALVLLVAIAGAAAMIGWRLASRGPAGELNLPRLAPQIAIGLICAGFALAVAVGAKESSSRQLTPGATRLVTLQSNRYAYWRVAIRAFGDEPLRGVGAGGWAVYWLRYRTFAESAQDAHSLPLQTMAELGLVGLGLLVAFLGGVAVAARDAYRVDRAVAAGPIAGFVVWVSHAPLDWDWQLPAVTLFALVLAGALLALGEAEADGPRRVKAPRRFEALHA
jgi:hypothetical protein